MSEAGYLSVDGVQKYFESGVFAYLTLSPARPIGSLGDRVRQLELKEFVWRRHALLEHDPLLTELDPLEIELLGWVALELPYANASRFENPDYKRAGLPGAIGRARRFWGALIERARHDPSLDTRKEPIRARLSKTSLSFAFPKSRPEFGDLQAQQRRETALCLKLVQALFHRQGRGEELPLKPMLSERAELINSLLLMREVANGGVTPTYMTAPSATRHRRTHRTDPLNHIWSTSVWMLDTPSRSPTLCLNTPPDVKLRVGHTSVSEQRSPAVKAVRLTHDLLQTNEESVIAAVVSNAVHEVLGGPPPDPAPTTRALFHDATVRAHALVAEGLA